MEVKMVLSRFFIKDPNLSTHMDFMICNPLYEEKGWLQSVLTFKTEDFKSVIYTEEGMGEDSYQIKMNLVIDQNLIDAEL